MSRRAEDFEIVPEIGSYCVIVDTGTMEVVPRVFWGDRCHDRAEQFIQHANLAGRRWLPNVGELEAMLRAFDAAVREGEPEECAAPWCRRWVFAGDKAAPYCSDGCQTDHAADLADDTAEASERAGLS